MGLKLSSHQQKKGFHCNEIKIIACHKIGWTSPVLVVALHIKKLCPIYTWGYSYDIDACFWLLVCTATSSLFKRSYCAYCFEEMTWHTKCSSCDFLRCPKKLTWYGCWVGMWMSLKSYLWLIKWTPRGRLCVCMLWLGLYECMLRGNWMAGQELQPQ